MMKFREIKSEEEYISAIEKLETLGDSMNSRNNDSLIEEFELLYESVNYYEKIQGYAEKGEPIEIIKLKMNYMGLSQKDLIPYIGSKGIVSEVINKKRRLSKAMIRKLSNLLSIEQEILNTDYKLNISSTSKVKHKGSMTKSLFPFNFGNEEQYKIDLFTKQVKKTGMLIPIYSR